MQRKRIRCTVAMILALCLMMGGISVCGDEAENGKNEILSRANSAACLLGQNFPGPFGSSIAFVGLDFLQSESLTSIGELELLEATEADFDNFKEIIENYQMLLDIDVDSQSVSYLLEYDILRNGIGCYNYYFDPETIDSISKDKAEQIGLAGSRDGYLVYPGENVDWILENIFHKTPDHSLRETKAGENGQKEYTVLCYLNGRYYQESSWYTSGGSISVEIDSAEQANDGTYTIVCQVTFIGVDGTQADTARYAYICDLRLIDGKRHWTFYFGERITRPM